MKKHTYLPSDPKVDAQDLHKAGFKGLSTDESVVIRILANRSKQQLQSLSEEFKNQSAKSETLEDAIKKEFGNSSFTTLCLGILTPVIQVKKKNPPRCCSRYRDP